MKNVARRATRLVAIAAVAFGAPGLIGSGHAAAQEVAAQDAATLTLEEAIRLARSNNPGFLAQANDEGVADWNVRSAYAELLPTVSTSGGLSWTAGGEVRSQELNFGFGRQPDRMSSRYGLSVGFGFSGSTLFEIAQARASRAATEASVDAAAFALEAAVTAQYLAALRARDAVAIAERDLEAADEAFRLAEARVAAGAAARVESAQAIAERGRAEVGLIQARANEQLERLRLLQVIGIDLARPIRLTSEFDVFEPTWTLEELTQEALARHPLLVAARAQESATRATARAAKMSYLPSINIGGGWGGFSQKTLNEDFLIQQAQQGALNAIENCQELNDFYSRLARPLPPQDCSEHAFTEADRHSIIAENSRFPFEFTKSSPSFGMTISLPLFNGLNREVQMQQANAAADDAEYRRREQELAQRATVAAAFLQLETAYQTVSIEERNLAAAEEQLELAQERYRLGAGSIVELAQAQAARARADQAHLGAVYSFHENLAALESAIGRSLRARE